MCGSCFRGHPLPWGHASLFVVVLAGCHDRPLLGDDPPSLPESLLSLGNMIDLFGALDQPATSPQSLIGLLVPC